MAEVVEVNKGECVNLEVVWTDEDGTPIDLTGRTLSIVESYPVALVSGVVTVTDAAAGVADLFIDAATASKMGAGRTNWIRLGMGFDTGCKDTSPKIWLGVV